MWLSGQKQFIMKEYYQFVIDMSLADKANPILRGWDPDREIKDIAYSGQSVLCIVRLNQFSLGLLLNELGINGIRVYNLMPKQ